MSRRGAGVGFCGIAALLYAVNYVTAVMWMPQVGSWQTDLGRLGAAYQEVGYGLTVLAVASLGVGVSYLIWAERGERRTAEREAAGLDSPAIGLGGQGG